MVVAELDMRVSEFLHGASQPYLPRWALVLLELSADFRLFFPAAVAALAVAAPAASLMVPLLGALVVDLAVVGLAKMIIRRPRPHYNRGMVAAVSADQYSFPSGHSSRVFLAAAMLQVSGCGGGYGGVVWGWALATSGSRVLLGRHYAMDVVCGACLGVLEALFAFHYLTADLLFSLFYSNSNSISN